MKLRQALEIGKRDNCKTVGEALDNIELRAEEIFGWENVDREINELMDEFDNTAVKVDESLETAIYKITQWETQQ